MTANQIKENDVFRFTWNEETRKESSRDLGHCFDGILIARVHENIARLVDTYWSSGDSKVFTLEDALKKGKLTRLCNLDEMENIQENQTQYFADEDIVTLRIHAGHRTQYLIKKGTLRSKDKIIESIKAKISDEERNIRFAEHSISRLRESLIRVESGDTEVFF